MAQGEIERLLALIDEAYEGPAWHGPSLRSALRGVTAEQAAWRPAPTRHNIWELAVHAAYWKYAVRRRLIGEKRGGFSEPGRNWFERATTESIGTSGNPAAAAESAKAWRSDLSYLSRIHKELRATVSGMKRAELDRHVQSSRHTRRRMIAGIAFHDAYHAGQIQLLKRLVQGQ